MSQQQSGGAGKRTLVEEGTEFRGSLSSKCPVEVNGVVEGDVTAPALTVSAAGSVRGKVVVTELRSHGELAGEFDADVVQLSGVVRDNTVIRAKSLEVKLAPEKGKLQVIFGDCELEVGEPNAKKSVSVAPEATTTAAEAPAPDAAIVAEAAEAKDEAKDEDETPERRRGRRKSESNGSITPPPADPSA